MLNRALLLCCIAVAGTLPAGHGQPNQSARVKPVVFAGSAQVSNIRGFAQDAYGFLWMASQDGLYVYDGRNTNVFNAGEAAPRGLMARDIRA
ncbi:MAG TPA: hypothetical protein PKD90_04395, partial [Phnomibacter sp.]|nr:hypothetical protein [Phnomibacter sp.]